MPHFSSTACHSASPIYKKAIIKLRNSLLKNFYRLRTQVKNFLHENLTHEISCSLNTAGLAGLLEQWR